MCEEDGVNLRRFSSETCRQIDALEKQYVFDKMEELNFRLDNLYIYFACLSVCWFVTDKRQNGLNRSGPNFLWDLT